MSALCINPLSRHSCLAELAVSLGTKLPGLRTLITTSGSRYLASSAVNIMQPTDENNERYGKCLRDIRCRVDR